MKLRIFIFPPPFFCILDYGDKKICFPFYKKTEKIPVIRKYGVLQYWLQVEVLNSPILSIVSKYLFVPTDSEYVGL